MKVGAKLREELETQLRSLGPMPRAVGGRVARRGDGVEASEQRCVEA